MDKKLTPGELDALEQKQQEFYSKVLPRMRQQAEYLELNAKISLYTLQKKRADLELAQMKVEEMEAEKEANSKDKKD